MTEQISKCIQFAHWCRRNNFDPTDAGELLALARQAFRAGERECNTGVSADPARRRFEAKAEAMGMRVSWPGLVPTLHRGLADVIYLPAV